MVVRPLLTAAVTVTVALGGCASGRPAPPVAATPWTTARTGTAPEPARSSAAAVPEPTRSSAATASASASPGPSAAGTTRRYVFPVDSDDVDFHPTHAKYPATDIFADCGEPVVAPAPGRILEVSRQDRYVKGRPDGPLNGGLSVSLLGDDGVRYYGSHLSSVRAGIDAGTRVVAGQRLGAVGRTGNANGVCHLHFGISPPCAGTGDWQVRRGVVWPAPFLTAWRRGGALSPAATVAAWRQATACRP